jgi:hypothetical protein
MNIRLAVVILVGLGTVAALAEEPPSRRLLRGEDATKAKALEKRIDELREAGSFSEAQAVARTLLELRRRVQGDNHWETGDAPCLQGRPEVQPRDAFGKIAGEPFCWT